MKRNGHDYSQRIKQRFPEFEKGWKKLVNEVGIDLVNFLKDRLRGDYSFIKGLATFKIKMIVDNNFILGQIKSAIKTQKKIEDTLIYKLMSSKSVEMLAPILLEKELTEKIRQTIRPEDQELAMSYALLLLPKISLKDAQWVDSWKKANNLIGESDPNDVPYLALAFEVDGHGILSFDNVFHKQGDIKVWKHGDASQVVTNYNSGFISMILIGNTGELLAKLLAIVFRFIRDTLLKLVKFLLKLAESVAMGLANIPWPILLGLIAMGVIYREEIAAAGKDLMKYVVEKGREIVEKVKAAIKEFSEILAKALEVARLGATVAFEFLGFLLDEFLRLGEQMEELRINENLQMADVPSAANPASKSRVKRSSPKYTRRQNPIRLE